MKNHSQIIRSIKQNRGRMFYLLPVFALLAIILTLLSQPTAQMQERNDWEAPQAPLSAQPAILAASGASKSVVVFPDPGNAPASQTVVPGLPANANPQGVAYYGSDNGLIADVGNSRIFVVQVSTGALLDTINTTAAGYGGSGTLTVSPNQTTALAMGNSTTLYVIHGPFNASSTISTITLPGSIGSYQTQAIVFNSAGRAFVYTTAGVSVLDAPYTSIAFTMSVLNIGSGAIAISPNGNTLLFTDLGTTSVGIIQAPFSSASTLTGLTIPGGSNLDGIAIAPDGASAIVVSNGSHHAAGIAAPFTSSSTVSNIPLPAGVDQFEDVGISSDSQLAILAGGSINEPAVFVQAPFNGTSVTSNVPLSGVANTSRGRGSVRFRPPVTTVGTYPNATTQLAADTTVAPDAAPTGATTINVATNTNFKGTFAANPSTGVVLITDAHPAGSYPVTVRAFGPGGTTTRTFTLTVTNGTSCTGTVQFASATDVSVGLSPYGVAIGDFNNDGKQDLASASYGANAVSIRLGDGSGNFLGSTNVSVGSGPYSVAIGDFNNDGNQDFATANYTSNTVSIRLGDGSGGFSGTTSISVGSHPYSIAVGDFNNDGYQDFATANYGANTVSIRLGDGSGGFSGTTSVAVGFTPTGVTIGDFNNDGKQDIVATNSGADTASIRLGDGMGGFNGTTEISAGSSSRAAVIGDFNNDGNQDLAFADASPFGNTVAIRLGNGTGGFSGSNSVGAGQYTYGLATGDFNNDGKQDIAAVNWGSDTVSVRTGDGLGGFSGSTNLSIGASPFGVAVGDFNGDGKQDLVTANSTPNTLSIRLGGCVGAPTPTPTPTPTPAAFATVDGRVLTSDGRGLRNAVVKMTDANNVIRTVTTSSFGFYSFDNVATGQSYTIAISSRLYRFQPQVVQVSGNLSNVDFVGLE